MSKFDVDFGLIAERISPTHKRGATTNFWLGALLKPLQTLRDTVFNTDAPLLEDEAKKNSQTIVFEQILNDLAGVTEPPKIFIENNLSTVDQLIFRKKNEGYPAVFHRNQAEVPSSPVYYRNEVETITDFDFIVYVPSAVFATSEQVIRAEVERVKLIGVNYDVQSY